MLAGLADRSHADAAAKSPPPSDPARSSDINSLSSAAAAWVRRTCDVEEGALEGGGSVVSMKKESSSKGFAMVACWRDVAEGRKNGAASGFLGACKGLFRACGTREG